MSKSTSVHRPSQLDLPHNIAIQTNRKKVPLSIDLWVSHVVNVMRSYYPHIFFTRLIINVQNMGGSNMI